MNHISHHDWEKNGRGAERFDEPETNQARKLNKCEQMYFLQWNL